MQAVDTAVAMNALGDHGIPVPDYIEENVSAKVVLAGGVKVTTFWFLKTA